MISSRQSPNAAASSSSSPEMLHHEMPDCAEKHILVLLHYLQREEQKDQGIVHQCLERLKQAMIAENINILLR